MLTQPAADSSTISGAIELIKCRGPETVARGGTAPPGCTNGGGAPRRLPGPGQMTTHVRGVAPRCSGSLATLLGLLLLAAAATAQAAAVRGPLPPAAVQAQVPPVATQSPSRPAAIQGNVHHGASQSPARPGGRSRNDRHAALFSMCAMKVRGGELPSHVDLDLDPLQKYFPPESAATFASETPPPEEQVGAELPDGCTAVGRVGHTTLRCTGANMTQIPDLSQARNVESLVFQETGIQVVNDVSHLPRSVRDLTFTQGPLVTFNGLRFYQISGLDSLSLDHNTLSSWSFVTAFYSPSAPRNASIRVLHLHYNLIHYPPNPIGANESVLPLLEMLVMSHNPVCNLPGNLFMPLRASKLRGLFLRNCSISQFYDSPLEPVSAIETLDLSYNPGLSNEELHRLFEPLSEGHLKELYLANNNYVTVPTDALAIVSGGLEKLDLHGAALQCLDNTSFPLLPKLKELNLMYCRIAQIRPHTFEVFPVLEVLNLDGNALFTIPTEVLVPTLRVLTMSDNPHSTGDDDAMPFSMEYVDFRNMDSLTNVTLEEVPLGHVEKQYFNDLHGLQDLRLTSCKIKYIEAFSFKNLTQLQRLYLDYNELGVLQNNTFAGLVSLVYLDLSNNKIVFRSDYEASLVPSPAQHQDSGGVASSAAMTLLNLPRAVASWVQGDRAAAGSGGSGENGAGKNSQPRLQVAVPFAGLTALQHLDLSHNGIQYMTASHWQDLQQLVKLWLTNNNIQEWYTSMFSNSSQLSELLLSYNSISNITEPMMQDFSLPSLTAVDLRHNDFQCDCSLATLCNNINTSIFVEFSSYRCSEQGHDLSFEDYIAEVTCTEATIPENKEQDDAPPSRLAIIVITLSIMMCVLTSVTFYRKRWYFRYLVYKVKMKTDQYKEDADHYLYDIFVCYSQADRQWVFEHLVARLEDGGRYRVCVHERDFTVGQEITENIITSIDRSRKVVMVLSPAFVDSSWCMFELQLASHKILDERRNKLILVLLEALPSHRQPKKLRFLLRSRTYLAWHADPEGQRLFWVRLHRAVTKPTASEIVHITHM